MDRPTDQNGGTSPFLVVRVTAPVRQQVEGGLRAMISEGRLAPGERLVERDLAEKLGVSRPLLREALRQLEAEGLVANLPNRGVAVARLTVEEAREIYKIRALLEALAAQTFAETASASAIAALVEKTKTVERALAADDSIELRRAKNRFYETLIDECGNYALGQMLRIIHNRIQLLRTIMLSNPARMRAATSEIRAICDAIAARDAARANECSFRHIRNAERAMEEAFAAIDWNDGERDHKRG